MSSSSPIPAVPLAGGAVTMPVLGLGVFSSPLPEPAVMKQVLLDAVSVGYRHFDTARLYGTEDALGDAVADAVRLGLVAGRHEVFVTSKLWTCDARPHRVLPALRETLRNLKLEYVDQYLLHWPVCTREGVYEFPIKAEDLCPFNLKGVWEAMEECQQLGLAKTIGISNFSCKKMDELLSFAKIPPAINQVEMNPLWQQKELREYCSIKGICLSAYSPLGGQNFPGSSNIVLESEVLKEIAKNKGKTVAQVCLRWLYELGVIVMAKSFRKERMEENMKIFGWELSKEETAMIESIPQRKKLSLDVSILGDLSPEVLAEVESSVV